MQIGSQQWRELIVRGAAEHGVGVSQLQAEQFARHAVALVDWNRKINLTAIVDPVQIAVKHYLDAILPINHIPANGPLLDLGTGGGFPGIALKIMRPDQPMTLIDGSRKKISFVKSIIRELALLQVEAIHIRAEELAKQSYYRGLFQVIVSRAVADIRKVSDWSAGLVPPSGQIILYQGPHESTTGDSTGAAFRPLANATQIIEYRLPLLGDPRRLMKFTFLP